MSARAPDVVTEGRPLRVDDLLHGRGALAQRRAHPSADRARSSRSAATGRARLRSARSPARRRPGTSGGERNRIPGSTALCPWRLVPGLERRGADLRRHRPLRKRGRPSIRGSTPPPRQAAARRRQRFARPNRRRRLDSRRRSGPRKCPALASRPMPVAGQPLPAEPPAEQPQAVREPRRGLARGAGRRRRFRRPSRRWLRLRLGGQLNGRNRSWPGSTAERPPHTHSPPESCCGPRIFQSAGSHRLDCRLLGLIWVLPNIRTNIRGSRA